MHTAQLICKTDRSVKSDILENIDLKKAKEEAKKNYQEKYDKNKNWRDHWKTFDKLLEDSEYKTS